MLQIKFKLNNQEVIQSNKVFNDNGIIEVEVLIRNFSIHVQNLSLLFLFK